jgi:hypothetical protein
MKFILSSLIVLVIAFSGCTTTGNLKGDLSGFWNSSGIQTELAQIQQEAIDFINSFLHSHLGGTTNLTVRSPSVAIARAKAVAQIKANHPKAADSVIQNAVDAEFAKSLGK